MAELRRGSPADVGEAERESRPRSGVLFRGEPVDDEIDGDTAPVDLGDEEEPLELRIRPAEPRHTPSARPSAPPEEPSGVERAMLLGRAPIGTPRVPEMSSESIDLDALLRASRSSRPPAAPEPEAEWAFLPVIPDVHPAQVPAIVHEAPPARSGGGAALGTRVGIGVAVTLAVAGAFYVGANVSTGRPAESAAAPPNAPVVASTEAAAMGETAPAIAAAPHAPGAVAERAATRQAQPAERESSRRSSSAAAERAAAPAPSAPRAEAVGAVATAPVGTDAPEGEPGVIEGTSADGTEVASEVAAPAPAPETAEAAAVDPGAAAAAPAEASAEIAAAPASAPAEAPSTEAVALAELLGTREPAGAPAPAPAAAAAPAATPSAALPELPSRADIRRALSSVTSAIRSCTEHRGTAMMSITIAGSGNVIAATPSGAWAGAADRGCLREAVGRAHLPRFQQERLTVQFPFVL